ncbi:MAG TPA: protoglobin domain-containing protein [Acidimicrobiales bacterium]|nr:protoglobin domain-containing protein [Acidimicrobiales bacterium]
MSQPDIPGYTYGEEGVATSPVSMDEFDRLKQTVMFGEEDVDALRTSREVLSDQVSDVLDVWYDFVASTPHLLQAFSSRDGGEPIQRYLDRVRERFGQWILDTAEANYDQAWLDYQHEIGLRHHRAKKNVTDNVEAVEHIPLRYLLALHYPITATLRSFLANKGHNDAEVEAMHQAWIKSVLLQVILWTRPYVSEEDF